ncbi:putative hscarg dehydrogenase [Halenospora varia]|nr:putative hscarg dehydrogenase [Halenospora varia]
MSTKKILVVFGATGNQGASVVNAILKDPSSAAEFSVRAVTRDATKPSAVALSERGVTVVQANVDDKESLRPVLKDAYACFAVTSWEGIYDQEKEIQQGKNIADIAKESNIKHLIWSSLPHVSKITNGKITGVLHFDSKGIISDYITSLSLPSTFLHLGGFAPYILQMLTPLPPSPSGKKSFGMMLPVTPDAKLPIICINSDCGVYVKSILASEKLPTEPGTVIAAAEGWYTVTEICRILSEAGGLDVTFTQITPEQFEEGAVAAGMPRFFAVDMNDNFKFMQEYGYFTEEALAEGHKYLTEPLEKFTDWAKRSEKVKVLA